MSRILFSALPCVICLSGCETTERIVPVLRTPPASLVACADEPVAAAPRTELDLVRETIALRAWGRDCKDASERVLVWIAEETKTRSP